MNERPSRSRGFLRVYWLCAAAMSIPVLVSSAVTGYWVGVAIGIMLGVMGVLNYRRAAARESLGDGVDDVGIGAPPRRRNP